MLSTLPVSKNQKDKLLEIANKLFPKEGIYFDILDGDLYYSDDGKFPGFKIHWFEFCLCYILPQLKRRGIQLNYWLMTLNKEHCQWPKEYNHPIDYIYFNMKNNKLL